MRIYKIAHSPIVFYHGTNSSVLPEIAKNGLNSPYLATSPELAFYYAEATDGDGQPVVLKVVVRDLSKLMPDRPSLNEPVGWGKYKSTDIEERIRRMPQSKINDWNATMQATGTVHYNGIIPPQDIKRNMPM